MTSAKLGLQILIDAPYPDPGSGPISDRKEDGLEYTMWEMEWMDEDLSGCFRLYPRLVLPRITK
ncbi:MAG: hypothetical protein KGQ60_17080 [Planctomycetes bacterium]|nr:hypothetical protein [Planctomycetota bacterium]